jgi:hypothetical protein
MQKKTLTTLIVVILIILALFGLFAYLLFGPRTAPRTDSTLPAKEGFTPRGGGSVRDTGDDTGTIADDDSTGSDNITSLTPRLRKLSTEPIAGAVASSTASTTIIRFVDRGTGHVFETESDSNEIRKISNTTIPKLYEALWSAKANIFIARYPLADESIRTVLSSLIKEKASSTDMLYKIDATYLPIDIRDIAVSPKSDKIFYLTDDGSKSIGYVNSINGIGQVQIWNSPIRGWLTEWPSENIITLTTKASRYALGHLYFIDTKNGGLQRIVNSVPGLTTKTDKKASKVIYAMSTENSFDLKLYDVPKRITDDAPWRTLPEKCVWSTLYPEELYCAVPYFIQKAVYPDDWYKGEIAFIDQIWKYNVSTGNVKLISDLRKESKTNIDAVDLKLDQRDRVLLFTDKNTLNLWMLDLSKI